jgi:hypothetical protein
MNTFQVRAFSETRVNKMITSKTATSVSKTTTSVTMSLFHPPPTWTNMDMADPARPYSYVESSDPQRMKASKVVYIATQTAAYQQGVSDTIISVFSSKGAANALAKKHLRKVCGIKNAEEAQAREGYHEGLAPRSLFSGTMKDADHLPGKPGVRVFVSRWPIK